MGCCGGCIGRLGEMIEEDLDFCTAILGKRGDVAINFVDVIPGVGA